MGGAVVVVGAHMMMQCPRCSTRWRVVAASPMDNPLFKCGRCHHLFRQFPGATPPAPPASSSRRTPAPDPEPDTLEFIFPERPPAELRVEETRFADALTEIAAAPPAAPPPPAPSPVVAATIDDPDATASVLTIPADPVTEPPPLIIRSDDDEDMIADDLADELLAEPADDDEAPVLGLDDDGDATFGGHHDPTLGVDEDGDVTPAPASLTLHMEESMRAPAGFATIMRAMGMTIAGFAVLALVIRLAPERTAAWLAEIPLLGGSFAQDHDLATKVELRNVQGRYQRLRNARRVFVISGDARNNSPLTIERIEVAGSLYGLGGGELDQKIVTTGNRTTLTDLSEAEIALLQRLDPVIALAPGEATPFLIVFLEPPRELREFSSRVLSVRPTRRASNPPPPRGSRRDSVG